MFFAISKAAGALKTNDQNAVAALENELATFRDYMYLHANLEEKFIHPLLSARVPGGANRLNEEHVIIRKQFDELIACFGEIKKKPEDFEKREDLFLELYLAWNRFLSFYFAHVDYEEEYVIPTLSKLYTFDELVDIYVKLSTYVYDLAPGDFMENAKMIIAATNPAEIAIIFSEVRQGLPPEAAQAILKVAEQVLSPEDWSSLKEMLKLNG